MHNGWAMIDAGDFAVHVLSRRVREKYFEHIGEDVATANLKDSP
jgi:ribosomal silencing factor RsfS